jgi:hypothetical protein
MEVQMKDQSDTALLALNEARVLARILSESLLQTGKSRSADEVERHAVLSLKVVEALATSRSALAKASKSAA